MRIKNLILIMILILILATAVQGSLSDDLTNCFSFDNSDTSGSTAIDSTGTENYTITGMTTGQTGKIGEAYLSTAQGQYVSGADIDQTNQTVCLWVSRTGNGGASDDTIISNTGSWSTGDTRLDTDQLAVYSFSGSNTGYSYSDFGTLNTWRFVCLTTEGSVTGNRTIYIDGSLYATESDAGWIGPWDKLNYIGGWGYSAPAWFQGKYDEVMYWSRALSPSEISKVYNSGAGKSCFDVIGGGGSTDIDFTITDDFNGSSILSFSVNITWANTTEETYSTTNGTVSLIDVGDPGSLDVTYWNITDYFDRTLTEETITENATNTITTTTYQAVVCFNATEKISESYITADNYTIGTHTSTSCFNITAGTHNVLAQKNGWYDQNQTFTITALSNTTKTVQNMSYANLTIYAVDGTTNETLSGYDLTIRSYNYTGWSGEDPSGVTNYSFYLINGYYNVTIDHPEYALTGAQANITLAGDQNYTFTLYKTNSVQIYLWDEITGNPILDNITIRWTSNATTWENITSTGELFISNITAGEYELLFYASNYSTRSYTITVGNRTSQTLNAYMINSEYSTIFTIKDIDTGDTLEDVTITMYKQINSTWTTVESKYSDISGKAQFYYDPIASYKFFLSRSEYDDYVFYLNPILFSTYDVYMSKTSVLNYSVDFDSIGFIYSPTTFFNEANTSMNFLISSPAGILTNYGIRVTYPGGTDSSSGVNAIGEQLIVDINITNATSFDYVVLEFNYTTSLAGTRYYTFNLPISVNNTSGTWLTTKDKTYGLGIFERMLIATIIIIFMVGISTIVGQALPGLALGLFVYGFLVFIGFIPLWAILPSMLIGVLFLIWKSGGY